MSETDQLTHKVGPPAPFTLEQLSFTRSESFNHETYDFNEEASAVARRRGLIVVYPAPNQLQIDVDSEAQLKEVHLRIAAMGEMVYLKVKESQSASAKPGHIHITITLEDEITEWQRIAMQMALGSDPMREFLNCIRAMDGTPKPTRFFEKPNQPKPNDSQ